MFCRFLPWLPGCAALFLLSTTARAETTPAEPPAPALEAAGDAATPVVVPPKLLADPGARYPESAAAAGMKERVDVVLVLVIDKAGAVTQVDVETPGRAEFDEAAVAAARALRFEPAQREGAPVAARIRYRYSFEPPPPPPSPPPAPAPPPVAPPEEVTEVSVRGERRAPTAVSLSRNEVRLIPGAFGDPFRAIDTLAGVTSIGSGLPFFYLRGAPPGNVGYILDGVPVPHLFHIGAGPSVVQPGMVSRIDVFRSVPPSSLGRYAGGVVSATATDPRTDAHGEAVLRLFDVGGFVESGFAGGRGTVLVGGRYSYTGALLSLAAPDVKLDYFDVQARATYDLTPKDRIGVLAFGAYDFLARKEFGRQVVDFGTEFYRADLRYDRAIERGRIRTALTLGYDRTDSRFVLDGEPRILTVPSIGLRTELETKVGEDVVLRAGASAALEQHRAVGSRYAAPEDPATVRFERQFGPRRDRVIGAYVDLSWEPSPAVLLRPGVRADLYASGSTEAVGVDPRFAAQFTVAEGVRLTGAAGLSHQLPSFVVPVPSMTPRLGDGLQKSVQTTAGVEVDLDAETSAGLTGFYSLFYNMTDALGTAPDGEPDFERRSRGKAFGGELSLHRRLTSRLGGFVTYTLSRSERYLDGETTLSYFDRPHVASAALSYDLGRRWRIGTRGLYYSGTPFRPEIEEGEPEPPRVIGRYPAFFRLDVRLEKRWVLGKTAWIAFVLECLNATLSKETWPGGEKVGPVTIPSLGVEAGF